MKNNTPASNVGGGEKTSQYIPHNVRIRGLHLLKCGTDFQLLQEAIQTTSERHTGAYHAHIWVALLSRTTLHGPERYSLRFTSWRTKTGCTVEIERWLTPTPTCQQDGSSPTG